MSTREPGTILEDKYEILQQLGSGGMGDIYLVRHLHLNQKRVIKILRQELASSEAAHKRFLREARLATAIKHPNVATLYDYSKLPDGSFYMIWEYIEGNDVHQWLERYGPFPLHAALQMGIQALRGLEAIHAAGVIHRDISPDNLMITRDVKNRYLMKIIDLGLAKSLTPDPDHEITQTGMFMGKLQYCSPEQVGVIKGEHLDRRSDLYSFSMVLYEMITGMPPFATEDAHGFIFGRLNMDPLPLVGRNPAVQVPESLDQAVRKGLARDREERFDHAIQYIQTLAPIEAALNQTATQLIPTPSPLPKSGAPTGVVEVPPGSPEGPPQSTRQRSKSGKRSTTGSLTSDERRKLLAQIDEAAKKVRRSTSPEELAEQIRLAITGGNLGEARQMIEMLESANPSAPQLAELQQELEGARKLRQSAEMDRAAASVKEVSKLTELTEEALQAGKIAEAEELLERLEATSPGAPVLPALRQKFAEASAEVRKPAPSESRPASQAKPLEERIQEAEDMLSRYLKHRQANLAKLALEALLNIAPEHRRKDEFASWVKMVEEEEEQHSRAQKALEKGREALAREDSRVARKQLEIIARNDPQGQLAEAFLEELEAAERDLSDTAAVDQQREAVEKALESGNLNRVAEALDKLAALDPPKLTLTLYRNRLEEARYEERFQRCMDSQDWKGAREVAHELSEALPKSQRPAAMFALADREAQSIGRQQSIIQGSQQVEAFLEEGDVDRASLALKILAQMDPDNPRWAEYEQKIESLTGS